jgi:hypothetical protein
MASAILIEGSADEGLVHRNGNLEGDRVESIMVAPLMDKESLVGVIEAVNRLDNAPCGDRSTRAVALEFQAPNSGDGNVCPKLLLL